MDILTVNKSEFSGLESALCRCCGVLTTFKDINEKNFNTGRFRLYLNAIKDCFGLQLSNYKSGLESVVCKSCVGKLRNTWEFKQLVEDTEEKLLLKFRKSGSNLEFRTISEINNDSRFDDVDAEEQSDGLDDELDPEQLQEYYSLIPDVELEPHTWDGYYSAGDEFHEEDSTPTQAANIKTQTKMENYKEAKKKSLHGVKADKNYLHNALTILKYSYVTPFKNRFNHVLCYYCAQYYLEPARLREHALTHSHTDFKNNTRTRFIKVDITRIDCRLCSEKIDSLDHLKRHLVSAHGKLYFNRSKDGVVPYRLRRDEHECVMCGEQFPQFHGLVRHMDQHFSNYVCETCGVGFMDEKSLQKHVQSHDGKRYPCDICGSSLKSEYTLLCHKRRIHEKNCVGSDGSDNESPAKKVEEEVPCQGCDQTFKSRRYLAIHVRKAHMNYRLACQVCGQKFFTRFALNNHMPTHTGERNFKCKECDKTYPRLKTLKEHMRIHTNDRRYRCHICGQAFIQNCSLKGHMKSKHPEYR